MGHDRSGEFKRPSVMDINWPMVSNAAVNQAAQSALSAGISITAAAGDNALNADGYSPGQGK